MDLDGPSKKLRKPYTITKSRDRWSEEEHERFLDALLLFGRDWKKIEDFVGTKTVIQIRSHAQKYFLKVQKNGVMAHVPPPRPKRNPAHPYPQKALDNDIIPLQASMAASNCLVPSCTSWDDKSMIMDYTSNEAMSSTDYHAVAPGVEGDSGLTGMAGIHNQNFCWTGNSSRSWLPYDITKQEPHESLYPATADFAEVYNFIGSMFDPDTKCSVGDYLQKLKEMDSVTAKTVLVVVKNLIFNMSSPDFEPLRLWLSTYDANTQTIGEMTEAASAANQKYSMASTSVRYLPSP